MPAVLLSYDTRPNVFDEALDLLREIRNHSSEVDRIPNPMVRLPSKYMRLPERTNSHYEEGSGSHPSRSSYRSDRYQLMHPPGKMIHVNIVPKCLMTEAEWYLRIYHNCDVS
ncbi:hypothetical protein KC349_g18 [Hortaea werneckii]|nr:hypothetical protein KC349_g18 [Hortaea werneckii]